MKPTASTATKLSRLHFAVATFFEGAKYLHQVALYFTLRPAEYGTVGSVFSLAYLSANLACLEGGTVLAPHAHAISTHPDRKKFIADTVIRPQLIQHSLAAVITACSIYSLTQKELLAAAGGLIALSEGLRIAFRTLVYALADSTSTAKHETGIALGYIAAIWLLTTRNGACPSAATIIILYAFTSLVGLFYLTMTGARALSATRTIPSSAALPTRSQLWRLQGSLLALHLPHNLFSANFIVPFFAYRNGMEIAGTIKVTSEIANAIRAIIKSSIGFPLNALLNRMKADKNTGKGQPHQIFSDIQSTATTFVGGLLVLLGIMATALVAPWKLHPQILFGGFCLLTVADYLCMPYEFLSLHSGTVGQVALVRGVEVTIDALILAGCARWPLAVVSGIAVVRLITWRFLARAARPALLFKDF